MVGAAVGFDLKKIKKWSSALQMMCSFPQDKQKGGGRGNLWVHRV